MSEVQFFEGLSRCVTMQASRWGRPPWGARVIYRLGHEAAGGGVFVTIQFNTTGAAGWWITCLPLLEPVCHSSASEPHSLSGLL